LMKSDTAPVSGTYRLRDYYLFLPLVLVLLALGVWGFEAAPVSSSCHADSFGTALYRALLLVARSGGACTPGVKLPAELLLAQFLLPLLAVLGGVFATVKLAVRNLRHDAQLAMVRSLRGHTVVCGLGATGLEAIKQLAGAGGKIVAVCLDGGEPGARVCELLGVAVVAGDAALPKTLAAAGISHARAVLMCTGSDARNMEICLAIEAARRPGAAPLKLFPEVRGAWLLETLGAGQAPVVAGGLDLQPFRANQILARRLLRSPAFAVPHAEPVLMFAGFGDLAQSILRQAVLSTYALPGMRAQAVIVDAEAMEDAAPDTASWRQFVGMRQVQHRFGESEARDAAVLRGLMAEQPPDIVIIALPDDDLALQTALQARRALDGAGRCDIPVFVRVRDQSLLSALLARLTKIPFCPYRIAGFGGLAEMVSADALFDETLDLLARAVHQNYLATASPDSPARVPWESLAERFRRSNRAAADHIDAKLRYAGYRRVKAATQGAALDEASIEAMAAAEHHRWRLGLLADGWRPDSLRSDLLRTHPLLVAWEDLPEAVRQSNRREVAAIPDILSRIGETMRRVQPTAAGREVLPCIILNPTDNIACAAAAAALENCNYILKFLRQLPLHAEALQALATAYPAFEAAFDGWVGEEDKHCFFEKKQQKTSGPAGLG
jgi:hypothetical protein